MPRETDKRNWVSNVNLAFALMQAQERAGFQIDVEKLRDTYKEVVDELGEISSRVNPHLPDRDIPGSKLKKPPKKQFKKDGSWSTLSEKYFDGLERRGNGVLYPDGVWRQLPTTDPIYTREQMSIDNDQDIKGFLMNDLGWNPLFWNFSKKAKKVTSPKFHDSGTICPDLERIKWPHIRDLISYLSLKNRRGIIYSPTNKDKKKETGWLADPRLLSEGRLSCGSSGKTNTHREKHRKVVNLPGVKATMGEAIRSCFIASPGNVLVGYDASALENRNKGHLTYMYDEGEYANKILDPDFDPHIESAWTWFPELAAKDLAQARADSKPGNYALPYGCTAKKLAAMHGCSQEEGGIRFENYWENNKPVKQRATHLKKICKKNGGYIVGADGRPLHVRSQHRLFNTDCQGLGSIIMDIAGILMYEWADSVDLLTGVYTFKGKKAKRVLFMHDEFAWDCDPDIAEYIKELGIKSIKVAGEMLDLQVALDAEGSIGDNYAKIH